MLLTSGYLAGGPGDRARVQGAPLLWKPYTSATLLRAVHAALAASREAGVAPAEPLSSRGMVLVVEDEPTTGVALRRPLAGAGYDVANARSFAEAREALGADRDYAVVVVDVTLQEGSGAELVQWLRDERPVLWPRTLIVTAADDAGPALLGDGLSVLRKPVDPQTLLEHVGALAAGDVAPGIDVPVAPIRPSAALGARTSTRPPPSTSGAGSVLLVEDDDVERAGYARALCASGFTVHEARDGEAALALLGSCQFDAVAADIGLPGIDGLGVLQAARALDADLPVLLLTGAPSVGSATSAIDARAFGYLGKPVEPGRLAEALARAVEAGQVARLQRKLIASRAGADQFLADLPGTRRSFDAALAGLRMVFQPIVRCADGSVFGYEALLRTSNSTLDTPPKLLAAAEVLGRTDDVGRAVRRAVAATLAQHPECVEAIFVNLHPSELRSDLLCSVTEPLRRSTGRVVLEVTERASLSPGAKLDEDVRRLREAGYRIAIDDLGEGYAGLAWLVQLKPDIAKIDMSLVRDSPRSPLKQEILGSLINVCRRGGITALAEGVETEDEAHLLIDLGCDLLQGYLFAKPGPGFPEARWLS